MRRFISQYYQLTCQSFSQTLSFKWLMGPIPKTAHIYKIKRL